jgi:hypothetical protein
MAKFKKKSSTSQDIPTAALPDIIFMLLFFFHGYDRLAGVHHHGETIYS